MISSSLVDSFVFSHSDEECWDLPVRDSNSNKNVPQSLVSFASTDVAAQGLDILEVDYIVQFDPPDDPKVI